LPHRSRCLSARSTALTAAKIRIRAAADCRPRELRALMKQVAFPLLATTLVGQRRAAEHAGPIAEY
jgi:hypothetical protein